MGRRLRRGTFADIGQRRMTHHIRSSENIAKALLRLLARDLGTAKRELTATGSREERIHRIRQRLKRCRTILRMLEPVYGEQAVALRHKLSEAARILAGARDADVAAASARELAATEGGEEAGFPRVALALDAEAAIAHRERTPLRDVGDRFREAIAEVAALSPDFDGRAVLAAALRDAYARGRKAMAKAETTLSTPDLHRWRKAVKELWHLIRLSRKRLPKRVARTAARLDRLGETLGLGNDSALLAEKLALSPAGDPALMRQLALIARRRNALEAEAFALGNELYRRRPKSFDRRIALNHPK
jgi:CHAD domain-containing protein